MMIEEHIKEALSLRYIELIAAYNGFKTNSSYPDYGTDLEIKEIDFRIENTHKRYLETGRELKFQLKATTEKSIVYEDDYIIYDLNSTTYNDLILRKESKSPLILIVFILPNEKYDWLKITDNELISKKCAYWYFPKENAFTQNISSIRVRIEKKNVINNETLKYLFENYS
jgi:hypothetical protein